MLLSRIRREFTLYLSSFLYALKHRGASFSVREVGDGMEG
jgi:hypothetical protein